MKSYRTDFHREPRGEEGFLKTHGGGHDLGRQVVAAFGRRDPTEIAGYFSKRDRIVISHPRTMRTLERRLERSGFHFNILMLEGVSLPGNSFANYRTQVAEYIKENGIQTEGHITFVKNGTSGHILTPWMVLHALGHAVADHASRQREYGLPLLKLMEKMASIVDEGCRGKLDFSKKRDCLNVAGRVFVFRSAGMEGMESSVHVPGEFLHELIAEYLWNGDHIRVRPPHDANPDILKIIKEIEDKVKSYLEMCVGQVIYDYYE